MNLTDVSPFVLVTVIVTFLFLSLYALYLLILLMRECKRSRRLEGAMAAADTRYASQAKEWLAELQDTRSKLWRTAQALTDARKEAKRLNGLLGVYKTVRANLRKAVEDNKATATTAINEMTALRAHVDLLEKGWARLLRELEESRKPSHKHSVCVVPYTEEESAQVTKMVSRTWPNHSAISFPRRLCSECSHSYVGPPPAAGDKARCYRCWVNRSVARRPAVDISTASTDTQPQP